MSARKVTVATKLSEEENTALTAAAEDWGITRSKLVADAVVQILREGGYYIADRPCPHTSIVKYDWGTRCDTCHEVLTGEWARE